MNVNVGLHLNAECAELAQRLFRELALTQRELSIDHREQLSSSVLQAAAVYVAKSARVSSGTPVGNAGLPVSTILRHLDVE